VTHISGPFKEAFGGKIFSSDEEVQKIVHEWLCMQLKDFFMRNPGISEVLEDMY
jgi:hypothetical protein